MLFGMQFPSNPRRSRGSFHLLPCHFLLLAFITISLLNSSGVSGRRVVWRQHGGGSLQSAANWDSGQIPGSDDDVVIQLSDASASSDSSDPYADMSTSNPWESSAPSFGRHGTSNMLTLVQPWHIRSLTISGPCNLVLDTQVHVATKLHIGKDATTFIKGGSLDAQQVEVGDGGTLAMDLAQVGSNQGSELGLSVQRGGMVSFASPGGGSNHLIHTHVMIGSGGEVRWESGPLILDDTTIDVNPGGTFHAMADILTMGQPNSNTKLINHGTVVFNSTKLSPGSKQQCGVPFRNLAGGTMLVVTAPSVSTASSDDGLDSRFSSSSQPSELRIVHDVSQEGTMRIGAGRRVSLSYSKAKLDKGSRTILEYGSQLVAQSGEVECKGKIEGGGEGDAGAAGKPGEGGMLVVSSSFIQSGNIDLPRLLLDGGILKLQSGAKTVVQHLDWASGTISGEGDVDIGHRSVAARDGSAGDGVMTLREAASSKVLSGPTINVYGTATIEQGNTLLMQSKSAFHVVGSSTLINDPLSAFQAGDTSAVSLRFDRPTMWQLRTEGNAAGRGQTVIGVPISCEGDVEVSGHGEALLRRESKFRTMMTKEEAGVRLQGAGSNSTHFIFTDPINLPGDGQYLLLQSGAATLQSSIPSTINGLAIFDGDLSIRSGLNVSVLTLGSSHASSLFRGPGPVQVQTVRFQAGEIRIDRMDVSHDLSISSQSSKYLHLLNLTLLGGSSSIVHSGSEFRVSDHLHWWIHPNASMHIEGNTRLFAPRPADETGQPCIHVDGKLVWEGENGQKSWSSITIHNMHDMRVKNRMRHDSNTEPDADTSMKPYEVLLTGGIESASHSLLTLRPGALLSSSCPPNSTQLNPFGCTFGMVRGVGFSKSHMHPSGGPSSADTENDNGGLLHLQAGHHSLASRVKHLASLDVTNGQVEMFAPVQVHEMRVSNGEIILHGYAFVNKLKVTGGQLSGFPVLQSALIVLPSPTSSSSNEAAIDGVLAPNISVSLHGIALICQGSCEARGPQIVMGGGSSLVVTPTGRWQWKTPMTVFAGAGGGGRIITMGQMSFDTKGKPITVRVPLFNRGRTSLKESTKLILTENLLQDAPSAEWSMDGDASVSRGDDPTGILHFLTGTLISSGAIHGKVEIGGRLRRAENGGMLSSFGDVTFSPTGSVSAHCSSTSSPTACQVLHSNGTLFLDGLANVTFAANTIGQNVQLMQAKRIVSTFKEVTQGEQSSPDFSLEYSRSTVTAHVGYDEAESSTSLQHSRLYDLSLYPPRSVLSPNWAPSPSLLRSSAAAALELPMGDMDMSMNDDMSMDMPMDDDDDDDDESTATNIDTSMHEMNGMDQMGDMSHMAHTNNMMVTRSEPVTPFLVSPMLPNDLDDYLTHVAHSFSSFSLGAPFSLFSSDWSGGLLHTLAGNDSLLSIQPLILQEPTRIQTRTDTVTKGVWGMTPAANNALLVTLILLVVSMGIGGTFMVLHMRRLKRQLSAARHSCPPPRQSVTSSNSGLPVTRSPPPALSASPETIESNFGAPNPTNTSLPPSMEGSESDHGVDATGVEGTLHRPAELSTMHKQASMDAEHPLAEDSIATSRGPGGLAVIDEAEEGRPHSLAEI